MLFLHQTEIDAAEASGLKTLTPVVDDERIAGMDDGLEVDCYESGEGWGGGSGMYNLGP